MKTSKIFIFGLFADDEGIDEIKGGANALWIKYQPKCKNIALMYFNCSGVGDHKTVFDENDLTCDVVSTQGSVDSDDGDDDIGVYIVAHGYDNFNPTKICRFTPTMTADFIENLQFTAVRKLCLVVYRGASTRSSGNYFMADLCDALQSRQSARGKALTPMIAGWETFVTIANPHTVASNYKKIGKEKWANDELPPYYGKKIAGSSMGNRGFVRNPLEKNIAVSSRIREKKVVMWEGGKITDVPLETWAKH